MLNGCYVFVMLLGLDCLYKIKRVEETVSFCLKSALIVTVKDLTTTEYSYSVHGPCKVQVT